MNIAKCLCCTNRKHDKTHDDRSNITNVASNTALFVIVSESQETPDKTAVCEGTDVIEFSNADAYVPYFFFRLSSGLRVPLQSILVGTFALIESTSRNTIINAMITKTSSMSALIRFRLREVMSREVFTVTWRNVNNATFCKREVSLP
ncbi:hypothetical protein N9O24_00550 [bacterium]|nr:hypothetical protein [bacterium]